MVGHEATATSSLAEVIHQELGQNVFLCNQCLRCSSGCPLSEHFDLLPSQVMRRLQLGDDAVLESKAIWLCASCQTCTTRCPQGLDVAGIMDALRIEARRRGLPPAVPQVAAFQRLFLGEVRALGRLYEVGLMAGLNLATKQPLKDVPMGLEMLRRRKLRLLPSVARRPRRVSEVTQDGRTVGYFPGCSLHASASEYDRTTRAVAAAVGLTLVEPPGWTCCGSTPAHATDPVLAATLPMQTLTTVEAMGLDTLLTPCSACFSRMRAAIRAVEGDDGFARVVAQRIGRAFHGRVAVRHLLDVLVNRVGLKAIRDAVRRPLSGLKIACYYGCLVTRPPELTGVEHAENPTAIEELVRALGAQPIDWSYKIDCCGASLSLTQTELALKMSRRIIEDAHERGADLMVTVCPLCHVNLDARQMQMELPYRMPILYLTQLMVLAFGGDERSAVLDRNLVDPRSALRAYGIS
ncbi:MAG: hypothetical protein Kow0047_02920 [Anaerolineae bacterium]